MKFFLTLSLIFAVCSIQAKNVAYIYGDVAADGSIPSGTATPFHQMRLNDTGDRGCSEFKEMVEALGYTITEHDDAGTTLNAAFLANLHVIVFGLHQKVWPAAETAALDTWIRDGGGILMYSDSAAGGRFNSPGVGIKNTKGQMAVNSILTDYGMQVTVDQAGGTRSYTSTNNASNPVVWDQPEFEGEGVSPVAVDETTGAEILIPLDDAYIVDGGGLTIDDRNVTLPYTGWASLALQRAGKGNVMAIFDRQPVWNNGEGSSIRKRDNKLVLQRIVQYLARDLANAPEWFDLKFQLPLASPAPIVSFRQWQGGTGNVGVNYTARNNTFRIEYSPRLQPATWISNTNLVTEVGSPRDLGDGSERVSVQITPTNNATTGFIRLVAEGTNILVIPPPSVFAGHDTLIGEGGTVVLNGSASDSTSTTWEQLSGPGIATIADTNAPSTTASFSIPGAYELRLTATTTDSSTNDTVLVHVAASNEFMRAINCGGNAYNGVNGFDYEADTLFTGGHTDNFPGNAVAGTEDDALYNTARSNHSAYTIPVPNGNYRVFLQFAETFFTGENQRVFDATLEGSPILDDLDLVATAPGKWVAYDQLYEANVVDGAINLGFSASVNNPLLNGIVIVRMD